MIILLLKNFLFIFMLVPSTYNSVSSKAHMMGAYGHSMELSISILFKNGTYKYQTLSKDIFTFSKSLGQ